MAQGLYDVVTDAAVEHAMTDRVSQRTLGLNEGGVRLAEKKKNLGSYARLHHF